MGGMGRRWGSLVLAMTLLFSFGDPRGATKKPSLSPSAASSRRLHGHTASPVRGKGSSFLQRRIDQDRGDPPVQQLEYDFYRSKCPQAELIIRSAVMESYVRRSSVAPALLRLAFHDCFIQGCDASVLLDGGNGTGAKSEKDAVPNQTLKGFDVIDAIKSKVEESCPGVVSCADILALSARDGLVLAGGPFYPVLTGRRDSTNSNHDVATSDLPAPNDDLTRFLSKFSARGFTERETVALLGGHNIGAIRCRFIRDRLYDFANTGTPDASLDTEFLNEMRTRCPNDTSPSPPSEGDGEPVVAMGLDGWDELRRTGFDNHYYTTVAQGRGILHSDQQLMDGRSTAAIVRAYASDGEGAVAFRRDFARAMVKMSGLGVLTGSRGRVRVQCGRVG